MGMVVGTIGGKSAGRTAPEVDGYRIFAADFHVHGFFGDGALPPWEIRREAARRGLDVVAITNHNQTFAARLGAWLGRRFDGPLVLVAEELTTPGFHIAAVGIRYPIAWRLPARGAIDAIHEQGGIAIAAHPNASYPRLFDRSALERLDGVEVEWPEPEDRGGREMHDFYELARKARPHISPVGSSDFHFASPVGSARTYVFATALTEAAILDALRSGRTVAHDAHGNTIGDPRLVALVERHIRSERDRSGSRLVRWLGVSCAWTGLLLLTLFVPFGTAARRD
ncbi:MAG TPA: CehA/McbA family metallohydrolase [Vicinamibacterales bacterium]|nr:CehA/McbA family metallohydrolase [Vicinamibacterales bacterium]